MNTVITPEFVTNFSCIADQCEDHCCHGWDILIDKATYGFMTKKSKLKAKSLDVIKRTKKGQAYSMIKLDNEGVCPFRDTDGLCEVHKLHGHTRLSETCQSYPRINNQRGQQTEHSLHLSCPEAARQILLNPNAMNLTTETVLASTAAGNAYRRPEWYPEVKNFFLEMLTYDSFPLEERLFLFGLTLKELALHENDSDNLRKAIAIYGEKIVSGDLSQMYSKQVLPGNEILKSHIHYLKTFLVTWSSCDTKMSRKRAERIQLLHDRLSSVLNEEDCDLQAKKMARGATGAYQDYVVANPHVWLNFFVYHMYNVDFPAKNMKSNFADMIMDFFVVRGLMMMAAATGELTNEDVILIVSSYYRSRQHGKLWGVLINKQTEQLKADEYTVALSLIRGV